MEFWIWIPELWKIRKFTIGGCNLRFCLGVVVCGDVFYCIVVFGVRGAIAVHLLLLPQLTMPAPFRQTDRHSNIDLYSL